MVWRFGLRVLEVALGLVAVTCLLILLLVSRYVEPHILARQDHAPHPEEHANTSCKYKGGDFYCTPFEARFLAFSGYGMGALVVSGIASAGLGTLRSKGPRRKVPEN